MSNKQDRTVRVHERKRVDVHLAWRGHHLFKSFQRFLKTTSPENAARIIWGNFTDQDGISSDSVKENKWEEGKEKAFHSYIGEKSIINLEQAIEFCGVDTEIWEVERHLFNSWDVTSKIFGKRTNYQCKLWFRRIVPLKIETPKIEPFVFKGSEKAEMWFIIGCLHAPFHDEKVWAKVLNILSDNKKRITGIILNGDIIDLRSLCKQEDYVPEGLDLGIEYSSGLKIIMEVKQALGDQYERIKKVFHYGNHEARYIREANSNSKYGSALQSPDEALRLKENGYYIQYDWKQGKTTLGKNLDVFHGQYYGEHNASKHLAMIPNRSGVYNHTHRIQSHDNGKQCAYSIGWLGDKDSDGFKWSDRFKKNQWRQGFGVVHLDKEGNHAVNIVRVDNGKIIFEGKVY